MGRTCPENVRDIHNEENVYRETWWKKKKEGTAQKTMWLDDLEDDLRKLGAETESCLLYTSRCV